MEKKKCLKCEEEKAVKDYWYNKKRKAYNGVCKSCYKIKNNKTRLARKIKLVKMKGGKCHICGYSRNLAAFDFHHVKERGFKRGVSLANSNGISMENLIKELDKCILLCRNCHSETHYPLMEITDFDDEFLGFDIKISKCKTCGKWTIEERYCSKKCASKGNRKVKNRPSKVKLMKMIEETSWCAIGRKYGVSDNAVRKWAKAYGII